MPNKPPKAIPKSPPRATTAKPRPQGKVLSTQQEVKTKTKSPVSISDLAKGMDFSQVGLKDKNKYYRNGVESVAKRQPRGKDFSELGIPGLNIYSGQLFEEFLPELRGSRGVKIWREMKDNDATIGGMLYTIEQLIQRTSLKVIMEEKDRNKPNEQRKIDLVETSLHDLTRPWHLVLSEILTCLPFGYSFHEIALKQRLGEQRDPTKDSQFDDGMIGWSSIELRSQESTDSWELDTNGNVVALWQLPPPDFIPRRIPISKGMLFRIKADKGNPEGRSILRNCWRTFFFKKRYEEIEGIAIERELTGLPVLTSPEGYNLWNQNDPDAAALLQRAEDIVRNVRADQHAGLVLPFGWNFELKASSGTRSIDTTVVIGRLEQRMAVTILADMLLIGQDRVGSFALVNAKIDLFSSSLTYITKMIEEQFNRYAIPKLMRANGFQRPYPKLRFGPVQAVDLKSLADFLERTVASGIITPTEFTEGFVRELARLPEITPADTIRTFTEPGAEEEMEEPEGDNESTDDGDNINSPVVPNAGEPLNRE